MAFNQMYSLTSSFLPVSISPLVVCQEAVDDRLSRIRPVRLMLDR